MRLLQNIIGIISYTQDNIIQTRYVIIKKQKIKAVNIICEIPDICRGKITKVRIKTPTCKCPQTAVVWTRHSQQMQLLVMR